MSNLKTITNILSLKRRDEEAGLAKLRVTIHHLQEALNVLEVQNRDISNRLKVSDPDSFAAHARWQIWQNQTRQNLQADLQTLISKLRTRQNSLKQLLVQEEKYKRLQCVQDLAGRKAFATKETTAKLEIWVTNR